MTAHKFYLVILVERTQPEPPLAGDPGCDCGSTGQCASARLPDRLALLGERERSFLRVLTESEAIPLGGGQCPPSVLLGTLTIDDAVGDTLAGLHRQRSVDGDALRQLDRNLDRPTLRCNLIDQADLESARRGDRISREDHLHRETLRDLSRKPEHTAGAGD